MKQILIFSAAWNFCDLIRKCVNGTILYSAFPIFAVALHSCVPIYMHKYFAIAIFADLSYPQTVVNQRKYLYCTMNFGLHFILLSNKVLYFSDHKSLLFFSEKLSATCSMNVTFLLVFTKFCLKMGPATYSPEWSIQLSGQTNSVDKRTSRIHKNIPYFKS
jgi:hypothetical protein